MSIDVPETINIRDQLRRVYEGPAWLGPSLKEILSNVGEELARRRLISGAHTVWELVLHITAWMRIARERLSSLQIRDHTEEENWPAVTGSWQETLDTLEWEERALEEAVRSFPSERLQEPAPASEPQSFYILLHGVVQHTAYHAGQIAVLKK
ncbi:MAG: DinB family protein [Bryobacteraceae bacterium]